MEVSWLKAVDLCLESECQVLGDIDFKSIWGQILTSNKLLIVFSG